MASLPYFAATEFVSSLICETSPAINLVSRATSKLSDWTDEEIARIRIVFQKLTTLRIQNDDDAEDLVQDTLLTMASKCPDESLEKGLLVWGMGILRKKVGNYYRRTRRFVPLEEGLLSTGSTSDGQWSDHSAESTLRLSELQSLVGRILDEFPPTERAVLEMHLEGHATREIARVLAPEPYQNVSNRLHRGKKLLALRLRKYGYRRTARRGPRETGP